MAARKGRLRPYRHTFWFNFGTGRGMPHKVPVRLASQEVEIQLALEDALKAKEEGGIGNSMLCAGSKCVRRYAKAFPHPVHPPADWLDSKVYIPDRTTKDGLPVSCVVYDHHDDIAELFDLKTDKLIRRLKKGPITIRLRPFKRSKSHAPPEGFVRRFTGERSGQIHDVVVVDGAEEAVAADREVASSGRRELPRPAAIGEVIDDPGRGPKYRFARAFYGLGKVTRPGKGA